jgi:hypothetical protein
MRHLSFAHENSLSRNKTPLHWALIALCMGGAYAYSLQGALLSTTATRAKAPAAPIRMILAAHSGGGALSSEWAKTPIEAPLVAPLPRIKSGHQNSKVAPPLRAIRAPVVGAVTDSKPLADAQAQEVIKNAPAGPPAPPDHEEQLNGRVYTQKPGGDTLVLALLVDAHGLVLSTKVMVPSAYPLLDMSYKLSLTGRLTDPPNPPLKDGDTVWLDLLVRYASQTVDLP